MVRSQPFQWNSSQTNRSPHMNHRFRPWHLLSQPRRRPRHRPLMDRQALLRSLWRVNAPPGAAGPPSGRAITTPKPSAPTAHEAWRRDHPRPQPASRPVEPKPAPPPEPAPLPTALRVAFRFKVMGGSETIAEFASNLDLPLALEPACLAHTDASFGELLRRSVIEPVEIKVRQVHSAPF